MKTLSPCNYDGKVSGVVGRAFRVDARTKKGRAIAHASLGITFSTPKVRKTKGQKKRERQLERVIANCSVKTNMAGPRLVKRSSDPNR